MSIEVYDRFNENTEESIIIADAYLDEPEVEENLFERTITAVILDSKSKPVNMKKEDDRKGDKWVIEVRDDDGGNKPHFHIWQGMDKNGNDHQKEVCIKILEPEYFPHGKYKDTLTAKQAKKLNIRLDDKIKVNDKVTTLWGHICDVWNANYAERNSMIGPDAMKPDYSKLEG